MALNLDKTRFNPDGITKKFWLYKCSNDDSLADYDRIDCLSGSDYTVISTEVDILKNEPNSMCKLVTILNVPVSSTYSMQLSEISTINLNWDGSIVPPLAPGKDSKSGFSSAPPQLGLALCICGLVMIVIFGYCRYRRRRNQQATAIINPNTVTTTTTDIEGLDQVTIDSYPMVVIGESGRLIKADNNACPICLSDYRPKETLKILPECLHRFHVECIDQWLSSKGVCPICRTSPPRISLHR
ncbi:putative RING-H2 finger protein ATL21A [Silene latifolia]|uniref:putative RING-H2 finger protein ATL21A n=1 Tax=Silene latifolia TaxID=37657 RepID=UPI003D7830BA